jgi:AcrR family transcriptional regulator
LAHVINLSISATITWNYHNLTTHMSNDTQITIINAARHVFSKHGYKRANMSLISDQCGFSRVTVHKYLANKEDAFRQCIKKIIEDSQLACKPTMEAYQQGLPCWQAIATLLEEWRKPSFKDVTDPLVLHELKYYGQEIAPDILKSAYTEIDNLLEYVLSDSSNKGSINLSNVNLTAKQVAQLIVSSMSGIRDRIDMNDSKLDRQNLVQIFAAATL